ncbi:DNA dC-_dU-editing enzyme APOBEC-3F-like [Anomaloglossus baeobatrachus]|uniref:DNA dC->dU-editing enzyme APOBEC-3F-like n=1 Tax=Anomaloglossus baeobatrachus TaxID=238106 RepID=UPI003F50965B
MPQYVEQNFSIFAILSVHGNQTSMPQYMEQNVSIFSILSVICTLVITMICMPPTMFRSHYGPVTNPPATHLCYEVYDQNKRIDYGHFTNTEESHAEEVFLGERIKDAWRTCTIVWYISWSPCDKCIQILLNAFLPNNPNVKLQIIFAKVYHGTTKIQELNSKGVKIQAMSHKARAISRQEAKREEHGTVQTLVCALSTNMFLMAPAMFLSHYRPNANPPVTHLCFEVYEQNKLIDYGHFTNTGELHAEEVFLGERFKDAWRECTIVWYISWSPCDGCTKILLNTFLPKNPQVKLHIIFAKVYRGTTKPKIQDLKNKGVQIRPMCHIDFRWCWKNFVDTSDSFIPWQNLYRDYYTAFQWLMG